MHWLRRNAVGVLALVLAVLALSLALSAYRTGVQRDEQARAIPFRLQRGEADLAERHRRTVAVLSDLASALRSLTFSAGGAALFLGLWDSRRRPSPWLSGTAAVLAVGAILLALGSPA